MFNNRGNIMNRKITAYRGRNEQSHNDQFMKESLTTSQKSNALMNHMDRRRKVFDGTKQDKMELKEEYKEICDFHVQAKNHLKQELKRNETMEYMKNKQDFEQKKQNTEEREYLKRIYQKNLQEDNKNLCILNQTNRKFEKLMEMHQDLSNNGNDYFSRNLVSYR